MSKLNAYWEIIRPLNSLMLGVSIIISALITGGTGILANPFELLKAFITGFTLCGASMAINDYLDIEIDKINEPGRPLPSGRIKPREALGITAILSIIGLTSSYFVSLTALGVSVLAWSLMLFYSTWGKRTGFPGNLIVSICIGLPFIYGGLLSGKTLVALYFGLIAFLSNTGREVTKGIVDVEGDREAGVYTVAVSSGEGKAARLAALFYLAAAASSIIPILEGILSFWYIPFVAVTDLGLLHSAISLVNNASRENARVVKNRVLYLMLIGLAGFAAGALL